MHHKEGVIHCSCQDAPSIDTFCRCQMPDLNWKFFMILRCYCFHISQTCTMPFYKIAPWQQCLYACGLILIVRHIQQHHVEILAHVQAIRFGRFNDAVNNSTCFCACCGIMEKGIFPSYGITFAPAFRPVVGNFTPAVQQVILQRLMMIYGIVYSLFQFTAANRVQPADPFPEFSPYRNLGFQPAGLPFFHTQVFQHTLFKKEHVTVCNADYGRRGNSIIRRDHRFLYPFRRIDIQKFHMFLPCAWHRLKKFSAAVGQTADQRYILHTVISCVSVAVEHSGKSFQKMFRMLSMPSSLIFVKNDRGKTVIPT